MKGDGLPTTVGCRSEDAARTPRHAICDERCHPRHGWAQGGRGGGRVGTGRAGGRLQVPRQHVCSLVCWGSMAAASPE